MNNVVKALMMSAVIGLGGLTVMPASAQDGRIYLDLGGRDGPRIGVDSDRRSDRGRAGDRWDRRTCSTGEAVRKASRMGVRGARVVDTGRRTIEVAGRRHGDRVMITFGRQGDCPVLRR